jgi:hypothetical protein
MVADMIIDNETPNGKIKSTRIAISIQGYRNAISIGKEVVHVLGNPPYICLRVNDTYKSVAISPCEPTEVLSFKTPENLFTNRHVVFRIYSQEFIKGLLRANGLDTEQSYSLKGTYSEKNNAVVFSFDEVQREG